MALVAAALLAVSAAASAYDSSTDSCFIFPGATVGPGSISITKVADAGACCALCTNTKGCFAWTFHKKPAAGESKNCYLKGNAKPLSPPRPVDRHNNTLSGLTAAAKTCTPGKAPAELCPQGFPCPSCGQQTCSCYTPPAKRGGFACLPGGPGAHLPFCDTKLPVEARVKDLVARINDTDKPNLLTARGKGGGGKEMQALPALGVPAYYWGTNCLHSLNGGQCVLNSKNETRCPTNFPSGPSFGATFDRPLIRDMANVIGVELRVMFALGDNENSIDCWGPVVNLNRDPRWGRNGEGGSEDAYLMGELAEQWTLGFQNKRPSLLDPERELLQGIITLKHMAVNSVENTFPWTRHNFDANETFGVDNFVLADYYLRPFKSAIKHGQARGVMCSYNAVKGKPTCLSPLIRNARAQWGFEGYVTSDSDSVENGYGCGANHGIHPRGGHCYPEACNGVLCKEKVAMQATALALKEGQCDINSGDTYNNFALKAVAAKSEGVAMADLDRALFNSLKQRFDLGLFDPKDAYAWPTADDVGTDASAAMSLMASQESIVLLRNDRQLLPLPKGKKIAVIGPHAGAKKVLVQPYPFSPFCPDKTEDCMVSPYEAIAALNVGGSTTTAPGVDLFFPSTPASANWSAAIALAREADYVVLGLGIETCGMDPAHNVNPNAHGGEKGACYQEDMTNGYVFPDGHLELEAHDRTTIDLPAVQHAFAKAVLALGKPTVLFLMNAGAVSIEPEMAAPNQLVIIEAFYPGLKGGTALAQGIFGEMNAWGRLPYTIYPSNFTEAAEMSMHDLRVAPGRTYRYYETPLFEFGAGLSLTNFSLSAPESTGPPCLQALKTAAPEARCEVTIEVKNTGTLDGDVVLLAYFKADRSDAEWAARRRAQGVRNLGGRELLTPRRTLYDYQRIKGVKAGGSKSVTFNVSAAAIAAYDEGSGDLVSEPGRYQLLWEDGSKSAEGYWALSAKVVGEKKVLDRFPSEQPSGL